MAKHLVKCLYCEKVFDANVEPFVMPKARRYAHQACSEQYEQNKTTEQKEKEELENYIKKLFNTTTISSKIKKQIEKFVKEDNFTYSGIRRSLVYFYEVKQNSLEKSNDGIGIVPWIYSEAYQYYYNLWLAQQKNQNKDVENYKPNTIIISIQPPKRPIKKRKLFQFLDESEEE